MTWEVGDTLEQRSPSPGPWPGSSPCPVRNPAAQQEVSGGRVREASSAAPHRSPLLPSPPEPSHQPTPRHLWKNCLPRNWSLVPKRLGTAALEDVIASLRGRELRVSGGRCFRQREQQAQRPLGENVLAHSRNDEAAVEVAVQ